MQNFYKVDEYYAEKFYQMPKVLFTSPKYKSMSNDAKIAYMLLKDRNTYSIKNHWFDEDGYIYFIFTNQELMEFLNCKKEKLNKIKTELIDKKLLVQKRMGLNKPNRLYLLKPDISAQDAYIQIQQEEKITKNSGKATEKETSALEQSGSSIIELPEKEASALEQSGSSIIELPEKEASALEQSGSSIIEHNQDYTIHYDTNKILNRYSNESNSNPNSDDQQNYFDIFTKNNLNLMNIIARNTGLTVDQIKSIIFNSKKKAGFDNDIKIGSIIDVAKFQNFVCATLQSIIRSLKKQKVENAKGYIYAAFYSGWNKFWQAYTYVTQSSSIADMANFSITDEELKKIITEQNIN
ncbi:replication initiator protein A [Lactobacillus iners]|uniref:replication initiator protein A n=1 Tax=Lactobacillus iners TaxID=147802 RepID=UPI00336A42F5|nr:replication initiator protein A [Lactobacillus crispatus]MCT7739169.1 replication initiator protein A [Lactobacillus iners]